VQGRKQWYQSKTHLKYYFHTSLGSMGDKLSPPKSQATKKKGLFLNLYCLTINHIL